jgi:transcription factor TGA
MGITNLQQSSQQAEDALSQGMEALQQSLAETLSTGAPSSSSGSSGNVANYMGQMAMAMGKLGTLEGFIRQVNFSFSNLYPNNLVHRQFSWFWTNKHPYCIISYHGFHFCVCCYKADNLRQQTLQQMHRILTTRQSARALLAIHDYFSRLRALSSLWLARPRD